MPDLLIRGETLPDSCGECFACRQDSFDGLRAWQCNLTLETLTTTAVHEVRSERCPLVELPAIKTTDHTETINALLEDVSAALALVRERETRINELVARNKELLAKDTNAPSKKVGEWILVDGIDEQAMARVRYIYCSNCGRQGLSDRRGNDCRSNYCPNCGAKMEVRKK